MILVDFLLSCGHIITVVFTDPIKLVDYTHCECPACNTKKNIHAAQQHKMRQTQDGAEIDIRNPN